MISSSYFLSLLSVGVVLQGAHITSIIRRKTESYFKFVGRKSQISFYQLLLQKPDAVFCWGLPAGERWGTGQESVQMEP